MIKKVIINISLFIFLIFALLCYTLIMKLAIMHDFLINYGGAERVIQHIHELYPTAPIYTLRHDPERIGHITKGWDVRSSIIDSWPSFLRKNHTFPMSFYPYAIEQFDFDQYDIVLSFSSTFAHGIITGPKTIHICYYHTPARFLWDYTHQYIEEKGWTGLKAVISRKVLHNLRVWDYLASMRPDVRLANSRNIKERLKKFYRQDSMVVYPGAEIDKYKLSESQELGDYYIVICRLTPPKRVDLAIEACNKLQKPLHVIGSGDDRERLEKMSGPTIKFLGFLKDSETAKELAGSRALLFPGVDDFGLVPIEAMACGKPVVALGEGGATETVIDGKTGILFSPQSTEGVIDGITKLEKIIKKLDPISIRKHAEQFSKLEFQRNIKKIIEDAYQDNVKKSFEYANN